jgi:hypothetical protein
MGKRASSGFRWSQRRQWPRKYVADRFGIPLPTARSADAACVECVRYLMKGRSARGPHSSDDALNFGAACAIQI